jgi:WD40 repeat protein
MRTLKALSLCCLVAAAARGDDPSTTRAGRVLTTRGGPVAFSPDGRKILIGQAEAGGVLTVWDAQSGELVRTVARPAGVIRTVAWSPDGRLLAAGGSDTTVTLWEATTGREMHTFKSHAEVVQSVSFSPDSKTLVSGSSDKTLRLWDVGKGTEVWALSMPGPPAGAKPSRGIPGAGGKVFAVAFSPDGKTVAAGGGDGFCEAGELVLWDAGTGKLQRRLLGADEQQVWSVAFSPDGKLLAGGTTGGSVRLFDVRTGEVRRELCGGDQLRGLAISPDGRTLAAAIRKEVKLWVVGTGELKRTLRGHGNWVGSIAFTPDGKGLVSGDSDGVVRLWALAADK